MRKFNLNGSLTTEGDLNIKGKLNIAGQSVSVEQETLTVKDNFIAINGEGTTLEIVGSAGIVVMSGKEQAIMANGTYKLDVDALCELIEPYTAYDESVPWYRDRPDYYGPYYIDFNNDILSDLNLHVIYTEYDYEGVLKLEGGYYMHPGIQLTPPTYDIAGFDLQGNVYTNSYDNLEYIINDQLVSIEHIEILCKIFKHKDGTPVTFNDFNIQNQAYAAPIYVENDDSLKIGSGTYKKDEKGNIISFTFGAGQGQSLATRADNIQDGHLIKWSGTENKIVDAGKTLEDVVSTIPKFTATLLEDGSYSLVISED
jgi:hypothetical protein